MLKQKTTKRYVRSVALIVMIALFASTFLLPISEARAAPTPVPSAATNVGNMIFKGSMGAAKNSSGAAKGTGGAAAKGITSGWLGTAIGVGVIWLFIEGFLALAKSFVDYMISPDPDFYNLNSAFIQTGWKMMRDLCNLFFLLALLFIAFCTILQIEKYNAKKNLLTLIIFALLINFSKPIAVFIFDGSQLLMQWFIQGTGDRGNITNTLGGYAGVSQAIKSAVQQSNILSGATDLLFSIIFVFIFDVILICFGLFLLIRIVVIWLLVIVSPFAFFAMILPDFRKLSNQWWDALFRYSYVGPAIAFFLWLATKMKSIQSKLTAGGTLTDAHPFQQMPILIPYLITIVFLFAALMMANQFGIYFAQTITGSANKFMKWAAVNLLKWGERAWLMPERKIKLGGKEFSFTLSPRAWIKGWQEHSAEVERRALEQSMAHPRDVLSGIFKRGERPKTYFRDLMFGKLQDEKTKELKMISTQSEYLLDQIERAKKRKTREAQATAAAATALLFGQNDQDDYRIDSKGLPHDPFKAKRDLLKDFTETGMSEQQAMRLMNQLGYIALPVGNFGYWAMTTFNPKEQKWYLTPDDKQLLKIRAKSQTTETQGYAKVAWRGNFMIEDIDPETRKRIFTGVQWLGIDQAAMLAQNAALMKQFLARNKPDTLYAVGGQKVTDAQKAMGLADSFEMWTETADQAIRRLERLANTWKQKGDDNKYEYYIEKAQEIRGNRAVYDANADLMKKFAIAAQTAYLEGEVKKKGEGGKEKEEKAGGGISNKELVDAMNRLTAALTGQKFVPATPTTVEGEEPPKEPENSTDD